MAGVRPAHGRSANVQTLLSLTIDATAFGMVLFIISIGLSIVMGLMRVINLAHGAFAMAGGYFASYAISALGLPYAIALAGAVAATVLIAIPLEYLFYRPLYATDQPLQQVLMTIGITFVMIGAANWAFGPTLKTIALPAAISGSTDIGFRSIPTHRLFVIVCGIIAALLLRFLIDGTPFGIRLRATVDNASMAASLGLSTNRIYAISFGLAVALAAFGGIVGAEILPIEPYYALRYMVTFLVVVSVAGSGSVGRTLFAALFLGFVDTAGRYAAPEYGEFFFYLAVIAAVLATQPRLPGYAR
jgi:branched-chain amino acid transport system permease protein